MYFSFLKATLYLNLHFLDYSWDWIFFPKILIVVISCSVNGLINIFISLPTFYMKILLCMNLFPFSSYIDTKYFYKFSNLPFNFVFYGFLASRSFRFSSSQIHSFLSLWFLPLSLCLGSAASKNEAGLKNDKMR